MNGQFSKYLSLLSFLCITLLVSSSVFGQADTGSIAGTVRDSSGGIVIGAEVKAQSISTSAERSTVSDNSGQFSFVNLAPGLYNMTANAKGFAGFSSRVEVTVGGRVSLDVTLSLSGQSTVVEVVGEGGATVNTQTQEISQIINPQQIEQLPSLTRNPYDFVATAGNISGGDHTANQGNSQISAGGQNNTDRGVGYSLNGQRSSGTEILLDGVENINLFDTSIALLVSQDSVAEFRVITNNFDAQYGRASGGVVNVATKSGGNSFHGAAYEFNRLSAYTANTFDNSVTGTPKGTYTRNQFGYAVGGPVKRDKLFFFQSTEWLRVRSSASLLGYVPTPEFIAAAPKNVQDYFAAHGGGSFNVVSAITKTDPTIASKINPGGSFDTAVGPTTPIFDLVNFQAPTDAGGDLPQNTYELVGRADYNLSDKTQVFFRYGRESILVLPGASFASPYAQYNVGQTVKVDSYLASITHSFTPSIFSSTKLSFLRDNVSDQFNTALQATPTLFLYNNANINNQAVNFPGFFNATTGTGGLPYGGPQNTIQISEDLSWTKGRHTPRFGGQYNYIQINRAFAAYGQAIEQLGSTLGKGLDNFINGNLTNFQVALDPQGKFSCARDFNTGKLIQTPDCTITLPTGNPSFSRSYRYHDWAIYAQDSWKIRPRLTLNYGMRYEHYGVQHNNNQALDSNLYYGAGSTFFEQVRNARIFPAKQSPIGQLWNPRWGTVAPRVGFAYDVTGNGTTSVRGGYGMSYERNFGNVTFNMIQNLPNYATPQLHNVPVSADNLGPIAGSPGTQVPLPPVSPRQVDQNIQVAQTQFWGLAVEHQLTHRTLIAFEYNGAHGLHLYDIKNINELGGAQEYLGDTSCAAPACYARPNAFFGSINNRGTAGFSHYNALNVRFQTSDFGNTGLSIVSNYTFAHALDNLSSTFSESSGSSNGVGNLGYLDPRNPALDYGNADTDIRHRFVLSAIWAEPFFKNSKGFLRQTVGGWTIVPIFTVRTGVPFTVSDSTNSLNGTTSGPYGIPRYTPLTRVPSFSTSISDPTGPNAYNVLVLPGANSFVGDLGISDFGPYPANMTARNGFRGPGAWNADLAVSKSFALTERFRLEFRAEGFNILNHHNFYVNGFGADVASATAANGNVVITGKKGGLGSLANGGNHDERRFGQFALRLLF
jgi:hypothetical protein